VLADDPLLERADQRLAGLKLCRQYHQARPGIQRKSAIARIPHNCEQLLQPLATLIGNDAELSHVRAQCIDQLRALTHQLISHPVLHQLPLLLHGFDRHEPHGGSPHSLADGLGIGSIVLIALNVGLHVLGRHQPDLVAKLAQLASPMVSRGASFHANQARWQGLKERHHLAAPQLLPDDHFLIGVDAVNLEDVLGEIQTYRANLHVDGPLM
jgi:hypothetical protein